MHRRQAAELRARAAGQAPPPAAAGDVGGAAQGVGAGGGGGDGMVVDEVTGERRSENAQGATARLFDDGPVPRGGMPRMPGMPGMPGMMPGMPGMGGDFADLPGMPGMPGMETGAAGWFSIFIFPPSLPPSLPPYVLVTLDVEGGPKPKTLNPKRACDT